MFSPHRWITFASCVFHPVQVLDSGVQTPVAVVVHVINPPFSLACRLGDPVALSSDHGRAHAAPYKQTNKQTNKQTEPKDANQGRKPRKPKDTNHANQTNRPKRPNRAPQASTLNSTSSPSTAAHTNLSAFTRPHRPRPAHSSAPHPISKPPNLTRSPGSRPDRYPAVLPTAPAALQPPCSPPPHASSVRSGEGRSRNPVS